nr:unnamed protein product [Digitaria exilis]
MMAGRRRRRDGGDGTDPHLSDGSRAGMARNRRLILEFMYGYYDEALAALPLKRMPALVRRLLEAGVCFGFGDPVTNIIANTLSYIPDEDGEPTREGAVPDGASKRKRKSSRDPRARKETLLKIFTGDDVPSPPEARTIAEHSLEGLVTFLTSYFPYLPTWDALRYLCLSRADLLVAVHLIELDRCHRDEEKFCIHSHGVKTALKCAALSARLPNVDAFLTGSSALVSHVADDLPAENFRGHLSVQDVTRLTALLEKPLEPKKPNVPLDLAAIRFQQYGIKLSPALKESVRAVLLDRIHAVYLNAISRIPMEDFRSRYHHGLLKAGYCYGPFDPFFNIIINTVWYDTVFPAPQALEIDMICTPILVRLESQSLDGLIHLLLSCINGLSEYQAMVYLLKSNLELSQAVQMAGKDGYETSSWDATAYKAAADASSHPESEAYLHFVMESLPMVESDVMEWLTTQTLSSSKILQLSTLLSYSRLSSKSLEPTDELTNDALEMVSSYKENFFSQQNFVRKKVEATLLNYEQTKVRSFSPLC